MPIPAIAPYVLSAISALGGIFGKKKKHMDSETLRQLYGPNAIGKDTTELANFILNSPYGQQLMASAAEQGQGLQSDMAQRAAISGLSPDTGASSGASDFQVSAATQAQTGLERGVRSGIYQSALPIAADLVSGRMAAALNAQAEQNADPSALQRIGAAAGQVAADLKPTAPKATTTSAMSASPLAIPKVIPDPNTGAPVLGAAPQVSTLTQPNQAPSQFRGTYLTNARSRGMRRALTGGR